MGPFLVHLPNFWGKKIFLPENPALPCTTSHGFLALCQNIEKINDTIPRKRPDRRKIERRDRQTLFYRISATAGGRNRIVSIEWRVQNEPITKKEALPVTNLFFRKFCFSLRTLYKELI